ncbi:MAG: bacteriohemerythrin [Acetivibrio ethanolgignens]
MFEFTDDCIIGIEQLDDEHRYLFELLNKGMDMVQNNYLSDQYEDLRNLMMELEDYAERHFADEEAYMEQIRDPELILQRSQHMIFREKIRGWSFENIDDEKNQQRVLEKLLNFLAKWLYHHIIASDTMIGKLPPLEEWMLKENPCEFTEEYRTGIELVDKEHEELFRIIDEVNQLVREQVDKSDIPRIMEILHQLEKYTRFHFQDEEEYMESIQYDGLTAQKRAHAAFIEKLAGITAEKIEEKPQEYMESLIEFLLGWLIQHILHVDKKIPLK